MLYSYRCNSCKATKDAVNRIAERRTHAPECCGEKMDICISAAPYGWVQRDCRYICPVTSKPVTTWKQRNELMKRNDLVDANDFVNLKTIAARQKKHEEMQAFCEKNKGPPEIQERVDRWAQA